MKRYSTPGVLQRMMNDLITRSGASTFAAPVIQSNGGTASGSAVGRSSGRAGASAFPVESSLTAFQCDSNGDVLPVPQVTDLNWTVDIAGDLVLNPVVVSAVPWSVDGDGDVVLTGAM